MSENSFFTPLPSSPDRRGSQCSVDFSAFTRNGFVSSYVVGAIKQLPLDRQMEYRAALADEYQRNPAQRIKSIDDILIVEPEEIDLAPDTPRQRVLIKPRPFVRPTNAHTIKLERAGGGSRPDATTKQRAYKVPVPPKKDDVMPASSGAPVHDDVLSPALELDDLASLDQPRSSRGLHA